MMTTEDAMKNAIAEHRRRVGLTQAQLAAKLGRVPSTVAMWELGINDIPASALLQMAAIFGVPISEIVMSSSDTIPATGY
jgi:transcriptional regulator with XRE-family HTH domain